LQRNTLEYILLVLLLDEGPEKQPTKCSSKLDRHNCTKYNM